MRQRERDEEQSQPHRHRNEKQCDVPQTCISPFNDSLCFHTFISIPMHSILYICMIHTTHNTTNIYPYVFRAKWMWIFIVKQHTKPKSFRNNISNSKSNNTNNNNDEVRSFFSHSFFIFSVAHFSILCMYNSCIRWAGLKNCGVWAIMEFTNIEHLLNAILWYGWANA